MDRSGSISGASMSSYGGADEGSTAGDNFRPPGGLSPGEDEAGFEDPHTIQQGVFGVLYTVSKEKQMTSVIFAFFRMFLDFLQLWLLVVNPSYGWNINAKAKVWEVVSFIQLNAFLSGRGYTTFLVLLYIFVGLLAVNFALSVWVAYSFSNNRFEFVWPIQFLRWFGLIFYQVLDIATLTLLLVTLDCNYFDVPDSIRFHNQEFPDVMCWSMPHIIHVGVSVASIVLFYVMATSMVVSEVELNPLTRNYMAMAHTRVEGIAFTIKVIATIASVMVSSVKWLAVVYLFCFAVLLYLHVKWVPFTHSTLNYVRCGSYAVVLYCSVLLAVMVFGPSGDSAGKHRKTMTLAMWIGMAPAALAGAAACHLRLRHFSRYVLGRFRDADPGVKSKIIYRFDDAREVEITARCCRSWIDEDTPEPEAVDMSEQVIKAGMIQLPQDPYMIVLYSSFLIDIQGSYQSGYTQLQTAKKQSPGLLERFCIFSREQEHTQKASGANGGGDSAVDLVAYVEFQRNHRLVVRAHREALIAMRSFWGLLLRTEIDFTHLSRSLHRIEITVKAAERAYRGVLARHGSSARLVRLYGKFLESIKFDPWAASKWYSEADRLDEEAEHTKEALQLGGVDTLLPGGVADRGTDIEGLAIICINAQSLIQVASPEAHALLGYNKTELKGKDIGIIMPPPFGDRHSAYVRNYINTGVSWVLDRPQEVVIVTKTKQVLPVTLRVTKVSGLNEDSVFLGVIEPVSPPPEEARAWVLGNGSVVAADERFCDWLGFEPSGLAGTLLEDVVVDRAAMREIIKVFSRTQTPVAAVVAPTKRAQRTSVLGAGDGLPPALPSPTPGAGAERHPHEHHLSWGVEKVHLFGGKHAADKHPASGATTAAACVASGGLPPASLPRTAWRHKWGDPLDFDTVIVPGAFGSVKVHKVFLRRCAPLSAVLCRGPSAPPPSFASRGYFDMLLVADHKGRIQHATAALAAALGRTPESVRGGGLDMLIPEPYGALHGPWWQELSNPQSIHPVTHGSPPPHSCRSGLAVSLNAYSEQQGPLVKPFRIRVQQRLAGGGGAKVHIVAMEAVSVDEALSERRLRLTLDLSGTVTDIDGAPTELFGVDPRDLRGQSIARLVDLFKPDALEQLLAGGPAGPFGAAPQPASASAPGKGATLDNLDIMLAEALGGARAAAAPLSGAAGAGAGAVDARMARALLELAKRSSAAPSTSWRVGFTLPPDPEARRELEQLALVLGPEEAQAAAELMGMKVVPAVMRVRLVRKPRPSPAWAAAADGGRTATDSTSGMHFQPPPPGLPTPTLAADLRHVSGSLVLRQAGAVAESREGADGRRDGGSGPGPVAEGVEAAGPSASVLDAADLAALEQLEGAAGVAAAALAAQPAAPAAAAAAAPSAAAPTAAAALAAAERSVPGSPRSASHSQLYPPAALTLPASVAAAAGSPGSFIGRSSMSQAASPRQQQAAVTLSGGSRLDMSPPPPQHQLSRLGLGQPPPSPPGRDAARPLSPSLLRGPDPDLARPGDGPGAALALAAPAALAPSLCLEVELWRADQLSGVLEVDDQGRVLRVDATCPLGQAGLVLGCPTPALLGASVADLMPLPPGGVEALFEPTPSGAGLPGPDEGLRGGLKQRKSTKRRVGEPVVLTVRHRSDGCALQLRVQAVRRAGPAGSAYLVLRPSSPEPAQPGFARWLYDSDTSGLMPELAPSASARYADVPSGALRRTLTDGAGAAPARKGGNAAGAVLQYPPAASTSLLHAGLAEVVDGGGGGAARSPFANGAPPPPLLNVGGLPLDSISPMRISALRGGGGGGALSSANSAITVGGLPSRLSLAPNAAQLSLAAAASQEPSRHQRAGAAQDSAYDPRLSAPVDGNLLSLEGAEQLLARLSSGGLQAKPVASPRQTAVLGPPAEAALLRDMAVASSPRGETAPRKQQSAVSTWVNSDGRDHIVSGQAAPAAHKSAAGRARPDGDDSDSSSSRSNLASQVDGSDEDGSSAPESGIEGPAKRGGKAKATDKGEGEAKEVDSQGEAATGTDVEMESEAGAHVANYGVGKRFKKLQRILTSPLAEQPALRLRMQALAIVAVMLVAHTVTFVLLLNKLKAQKDAITDLDSVTMASRRIHEVAINGRLLESLYTGDSYVEGLTQFGDPLDETLAGVFDDTSRVVALLKEEHHGVYLGFRSLRRIPTDYGLRDIWDNPILNMTLFYDENDPAAPEHILKQASEGLPTGYSMMGLWDAGNLYLAKSLDLYNNAEDIVAKGINFTTWSTWRFLQTNGVPVIFPAYLATLDALVQLTVQQSRQIYELQLIILCIEGCLLCISACVYMWIMADKFSQRRHSLYGVFVQIPIGVTRGLANMSLQLEAGEEEEEDPGTAAADDEGVGRVELDDFGEAVAAKPSEKKGVRMEASVHGKAQSDGLQKRANGMPPPFGAKGSGNQQGNGSTTLDSASSRFRPMASGLFGFWRSRSKVAPRQLEGKPKRRLMPSRRLSYALVAPFIVWGVVIIVVNLIGYNALRGMSAPIASLNVVNEVLVRFHRIIYYALEVAGALSADACRYFKGILSGELSRWRVDVAVMLYGKDVLDAKDGVSADLLDHFSLATSGVLFGGTSRPANLLYHTGACLSAEEEGCKPDDSPYYQATRNGLDVLLKAYFSSVEGLLAQSDDASGLNTTEFNLLWETGQTDMEGGLSMMGKLFVGDVQDAYSRVEVQQVAMFAAAWVWALAFLVLQLRPFVRNAHNEMRRIAELLSQLPSEVDVEALVTRVIIGNGKHRVASALGKVVRPAPSDSSMKR